jgi:hypothetical protein
LFLNTREKKKFVGPGHVRSPRLRYKYAGQPEEFTPTVFLYLIGKLEQGTSDLRFQI